MKIEVILAFGLVFATRMATAKVTGSDDVLGIRDIVACYGKYKDDDENLAVDKLIRILSLYRPDTSTSVISPQNVICRVWPPITKLPRRSRRRGRPIA